MARLVLANHAVEDAIGWRRAKRQAKAALFNTSCADGLELGHSPFWGEGQSFWGILMIFANGAPTSLSPAGLRPSTIAIENQMIEGGLALIPARCVPACIAAIHAMAHELANVCYAIGASQADEKLPSKPGREPWISNS